MRALGAYIFAGGFSLGVKQHFDVDTHLEETNYGVATAQHNFPDLKVFYPPDRWPLDEIAAGPHIDFLMGNPPCAAWSPAGSKINSERDWTKDPRVDCTRRHFSLLERLRPTVWAWESVPQAFTTGRPFVDELTLRAIDLGYSVTYLLHNAMYLGVPQKRRRFFFVAHKVKFDVDELDWSWESCDSALRRLNDPGEPLDHNIRKYPHVIPTVKPGETLISAWHRMYPPEQRTLNARGHTVGRPCFTIKRMRAGEPAPVVMHELIHPTEHRGLSLRELALMCGYPSWWEVINGRDVGQISRGVCPPVGEWLARNVKRCIERGEADDRPIVQLIDVTEPPGHVECLPWPSREVGTIEEVVETAAAAAQASSIAKEGSVRMSDPKPKAGVGSGAYIRILLMTGRYDTKRILELVHQHYPDSKAGPGDVGWNRGWLKKHGYEIPKSAARAEAAAPSERGAQAAETAATTAATAVSSKVSAAAQTKSRQALRTGERESNDPDREMDRSSLRANSHGQWVHRDYLAHAFRWGWAGRFIDNETEVLDVGCGPDCSLIQVLTMPRNQVPKRYVGVDLNREPAKHPTRQWATLHWGFNFLERHQELGQFDLVTNFEVIEHLYKPDGIRLLNGLYERLKPDGTLLLSTPVFNGKAAANHLHEWEIAELQEACEEAGFHVERRFGTFASQNDLKRVARPEDLKLAAALSEYYSGEIMSTFLAPLYPDASRNNVWLLKRS